MKTFLFLNKTINVNLVEPSLSRVEVDDLIYNVYLPKYTLEHSHIIIHELWHLFTDILSTFDDGMVSLDILAKDVYAYLFDSLYREVLECVL